jgi:hypothetical protein
MDAGWFDGGFPNGVGNWTVRKQEYPNGLKPVGNACDQLGLKFLIWWEPERVGPGTRISSHRVHQPEIELTSPTTATGVWALDDVVIETEAKLTIRGAAFYHDEDVKIGGEWKIRRTGYKRIYEEMESRTDTPSLALTKNAFVGTK